MVGEAEADVVVAEVAAGDGLLVGALADVFAVLGVEDVIQLQLEARLVLEELPGGGGVPDEEVAVHARYGVAVVHLFCQCGLEDELTPGGFAAQAEVVLPEGGVLLVR